MTYVYLKNYSNRSFVLVVLVTYSERKKWNREFYFTEIEWS